MSFDFLEFEEQVGMIWHRIASRNQESYRDHVEHAITFAELRGHLPVIFRTLGGDPALEFAQIDKRVSGHRLRWRQRIGLVDEQITMAEMNEASVKLPASISLFPSRDLNRDFYIWLMAWFAVSVPQAISLDVAQSPLLVDIMRLSRARQTDQDVCRHFPGIIGLRQRLYDAFLVLRPVRPLPRVEQQVEECVLRILMGVGQQDENDLWPVVNAVGTGVDIAAMVSVAGLQSHRYAPFLPVPLWGEAMCSGTAGRVANTDTDEDGNSSDGSQERKKRARRRKNDQAGRNDPLALNRFEKILSIAEMVNVNRPMDDEDEQDAKKAADELDEMEISDCKRKAATKLRFDLDLPPREADEGRVIGEWTYPEWDYRHQSYRPDFCKVVMQSGDEKVSECDVWHPGETERRQIRQVRRQFEAFRPRHEILRAQSDGSELDLEALVRARCDQKGSGELSDRLYLNTVRRARDLSVAVLVDVSLSTDAWIQDQRVLDVEKQALSVLAGGLDACGDEFGIFSFTSRRRDWVRINAIKNFDEEWSRSTQDRIQKLRPGYYTRLGAAIRHVGKLLGDRPHQHRLMLVITDGKPNDIDHYEGRYGIEDSRRAVRECRKAGLGLFGVTVDQRAQDYFPYIFGAGGHAIVSKLENLPAALPRIYRQLVS
ncbi:nitric oxide reductase activation protein NorD [Thalassospira sp. 11-3]|uniref:nitric oxide reductase activation protein NorD n=1 Tax=Thalassospira sp. 11-3 TaxID=2135614 RepID=UPI000D75E942|nr:VWA domain-containing protein [Thalassospira sp. 11-3]PXX30828.1 nitric oxide reductase NorD protein [Thalassospira sp. 11-3]